MFFSVISSTIPFSKKIKKYKDFLPIHYPLIIFLIFITIHYYTIFILLKKIITLFSFLSGKFCHSHIISLTNSNTEVYVYFCPKSLNLLSKPFPFIRTVLHPAAIPALISFLLSPII